MSGNSNVGNSGVYEAGDQRNAPASESSNNAERFNEGKPNSHISTDSKDQRSIANRLAAEERKEDESEQPSLSQRDPTAPAKAHGNEPSRGAKIDKELQEDDEAMLRKKDEAKKN